MKIKAFTIAESLFVLVLSGIVFIVVINAYSLVNGIYRQYVSNAKTIEHYAEFEKIIQKEVSHASSIKWTEHVLRISNDDNKVEVNFMADEIVVSYVNVQDVALKSFSFPFEGRIEILRENAFGQLLKFRVFIDTENESHPILVNKKYSSAQYVEWITE